eukprot:gene2442-4736_t
MIGHYYNDHQNDNVADIQNIEITFESVNGGHDNFLPSDWRTLQIEENDVDLVNFNQFSNSKVIIDVTHATDIKSPSIESMNSDYDYVLPSDWKSLHIEENDVDLVNFNQFSSKNVVIDVADIKSPSIESMNSDYEYFLPSDWKSLHIEENDVDFVNFNKFSSAKVVIDVSDVKNIKLSSTEYSSHYRQFPYIFALIVGSLIATSLLILFYIRKYSHYHNNNSISKSKNKSQNNSKDEARNQIEQRLEFIENIIRDISTCSMNDLNLIQTHLNHIITIIKQIHRQNTISSKERNLQESIQIIDSVEQSILRLISVLEDSTLRTDSELDSIRMSFIISYLVNLRNIQNIRKELEMNRHMELHDVNTIICNDLKLALVHKNIQLIIQGIESFKLLNLHTNPILEEYPIAIDYIQKYEDEEDFHDEDNHVRSYNNAIRDLEETFQRCVSISSPSSSNTSNNNNSIKAINNSNNRHLPSTAVAAPIVGSTKGDNHIQNYHQNFNHIHSRMVKVNKDIEDPQEVISGGGNRICSTTSSSNSSVPGHVSVSASTVCLSVSVSVEDKCVCFRCSRSKRGPYSMCPCPADNCDGYGDVDEDGDGDVNDSSSSMTMSMAVSLKEVVQDDVEKGWVEVEVTAHETTSMTTTTNTATAMTMTTVTTTEMLPWALRETIVRSDSQRSIEQCRERRRTERRLRREVGSQEAKKRIDVLAANGEQSRMLLQTMLDQKEGTAIGRLEEKKIKLHDLNNHNRIEKNHQLYRYDRFLFLIIAMILVLLYGGAADNIKGNVKGN